jgi:MtN3 and saliva related transmembrane protein
MIAHWMINVLGSTAALFSMGSFIPQAVKVVQERDAKAVSLRMYLVTVTGFALWTAYGVTLRSWPLIASNLVSLGLSGFILMLKLYYSRHPAQSPQMRPPPAASSLDRRSVGGPGRGPSSRSD